MLKVEGLSFSYGDFTVENVCFEVKDGEILTLLGPNGSGKTTILKNVYGLLRPKKKCVFVDGKDFPSLSLKERAKLAGYVPQSHHPPFPYTVLDVVVMGLTSQLSVFESPREEHYKRALEKLRLLGMERFKDRPYTQLSGGQLQLVLIARALIQEPRVLLDEPTAHLDFKNQVKILGIIKRLTREEKIAAVITLHDPNLASVYSDKIALVKEGEIKAVGVPREILREEILREVYSVPVQIFELNGFRVVMPVMEVTI